MTSMRKKTTIVEAMAAIDCTPITEPGLMETQDLHLRDSLATETKRFCLQTLFSTTCSQVARLSLEENCVLRRTLLSYVAENENYPSTPPLVQDVGVCDVKSGTVCGGGVLRFEDTNGSDFILFILCSDVLFLMKKGRLFAHPFLETTGLRRFNVVLVKVKNNKIWFAYNLLFFLSHRGGENTYKLVFVRVYEITRLTD